MVKVTIELDDDEYSEFLKKVGNNTPKDALLEALSIKKTHTRDDRSAEITWRLLKKSRDEAERQYYELLQASLTSEDGIANKQRIWLRSKDKQVV